MVGELSPRELARRLYYKTLKSGEVVAYDMITGEIVARSYPSTEVQEEFKSGIKYHPLIMDTICDRMVEQGRSLYSVCGDPDMPKVASVLRWCANIPEAQDKFRLARLMLAEYLHDKILDSVDENDTSRDAVNANKLKFDKLKYLASVNNPEIYGNKTILGGDSQAPVQFIISTGIVRNGQNTGRERELCDASGDTRALDGIESKGGEAGEDD